MRYFQPEKPVFAKLYMVRTERLPRARVEKAWGVVTLV